jgi:hypothetical protein
MKLAFFVFVWISGYHILNLKFEIKNSRPLLNPLVIPIQIDTVSAIYFPGGTE